MRMYPRSTPSNAGRWHRSCTASNIACRLHNAYACMQPAPACRLHTSIGPPYRTGRRALRSVAWRCRRSDSLQSVGRVRPSTFLLCLKTKTSLSTFRRRLYTFLFQQSYLDLVMWLYIWHHGGPWSDSRYLGHPTNFKLCWLCKT